MQKYLVLAILVLSLFGCQKAPDPEAQGLALRCGSLVAGIADGPRALAVS